MFNGNTLTALADRLRAVFVGRNEILTSTGALKQLQTFTLAQASAAVNLTAAMQDVTGATLTFTPAVPEVVLILATGGVQFGAGTANCNVGDVRFTAPAMVELVPYVADPSQAQLGRMGLTQLGAG